MVGVRRRHWPQKGGCSGQRAPECYSRQLLVLPFNLFTSVYHGARCNLCIVVYCTVHCMIVWRSLRLSVLRNEGCAQWFFCYSPIGVKSTYCTQKHPFGQKTFTIDAKNRNKIQENFSILNIKTAPLEWLREKNISCASSVTCPKFIGINRTQASKSGNAKKISYHQPAAAGLKFFECFSVFYICIFKETQYSI